MAVSDAGPTRLANTGPDVDPRVERSRRNILQAARQVLIESGLAGLTIDAVISASGVARATIYRHWPSREDLVVATIETFLPHLDEPPAELGFERRLHEVIGQIGANLSDPKFRRFLPLLLGASAHADPIDKMRHRVTTRQRQLVVDVIQQGVDEGALPDSTDLDEAALLLLGPLMLAALDPTTELDPTFAQRVVGHFLSRTP